MHWLSSVNGWIRGILRVVVILSVAGLTAMMTSEVILRYLLQWSLMGVEEMSTLFGLWLYYAGFALVSANDQHIRGGLFEEFGSSSFRQAAARASSLASAAICLYFLWLAADYADFILDVNRRSTFLRWPTFLWILSLNVGLLLSVVTLTIQAILPGAKEHA